MLGKSRSAEAALSDAIEALRNGEEEDFQFRNEALRGIRASERIYRALFGTELRDLRQRNLGQ
jgi:hypothetical protein